MQTENIISTSSIENSKRGWKSKISDYNQLIKLRLTLLVVFSAAMAYLWTTNRHVDSLTIWLLSIGGFLITASSNIFNQVIEKNSDKKMKRTLNRPLPCERMKVSEAVILALVLGISGLLILARINFLCVALGGTAMLIYTCAYTPMKKISSWSIVPGAAAGSLPVVIGAVAASGEITQRAFLLFVIQFVWQFPHTWSIAWLLNDEYNKAGLKMLPTQKKNKSTAILIMLSTFLIIPAGMLLYMYASAGIHVTSLLALAGMVMLLFSFRLLRKRTDKSAVGLMLSCFAYLPFILITLVVEKYL